MSGVKAAAAPPNHRLRTAALAGRFELLKFSIFSQQLNAT